MTPQDLDLVQRLAQRALVLVVKMIDDANHRDDEEEGDPKVGGHPAACSSCVHILSTLQLAIAGPFDTFAIKPHASPVNHAVNFLLGLFREPGGRRWMSLEESQGVMTRLRQFSFHGEPVFQSYHAENDPDSQGYFPTGSVGIPPVMSMYTALAYRYAKHHGHEVPESAHHWSLIGDSEFREGSLLEAMPEAAERELPNVTWIVDYNRQNLDGSRMPNNGGLRGTDADRMERTGLANGWNVIQVMHGRKRLAAFAQPGGEKLREVFEHGFADFEFQSLLFKRNGGEIRKRLIQKDASLEALLSKHDDARLQELFSDLAGHDVHVLAEALQKARESKAPTLVIVHTIKGWGLSSYAATGNHSALPPREEVAALLKHDGIDSGNPYQRFAAGTPEQAYLDRRGAWLREGIEQQWVLKDRNLKRFTDSIAQSGELPPAFDIDLKLTPIAHTQYVWGQTIGKIIRIGTAAHAQGVRVTEEEKPWQAAADMVLTMAPDVGTSTNINPAMDDKIYGPPPDEDYEKLLDIRDRRRPALKPTEEVTTRHIRFEIAEANCMSAAGAFGKLGYSLGIPYMPVMTIYDFFIKRAYDQLYYNLYWGSKFLVVGTPSGVTLSSEGAQHSWKSDIQMPNCITWEPMYGAEVDWIVAETLRRHVHFDDAQRTGVILRAVTRGLPQKEMPTRLRRHRRFKQDSSQVLRPASVEQSGATNEADAPALPDTEILAAVREDVLKGGYYLVDYRGYADYEPGDNVVHIFAMGALGTSALEASDLLLKKGIYANVIICTSPDLLVGNLAHADGYRHLREGLGIDGALYVTKRRTNGHTTYELETRADLVEAAAGRIPIVSVVDGEVGLLDNIGAIVGARHEALGLRKPSKCGRPSDVYALHHIDGHGVAEAAMKVLGESALERVVISRALLNQASEAPATAGETTWQQAWGDEQVH
jgi:pyruvate dehydrogenase E1 component